MMTTASFTMKMRRRWEVLPDMRVCSRRPETLIISAGWSSVEVNGYYGAKPYRCSQLDFPVMDALWVGMELQKQEVPPDRTFRLDRSAILVLQAHPSGSTPN